MSATKPAACPAALNTEGRKLWRSIARQWADDELIPDARERRLLEDACHEADMLAVLAAELATALAEGRMLVKGSMGQPVANPLVAETRRSRAQIAALLLKLGLDQPRAEERSPVAGMTAAEAGRRGGLARRHGRDGLGA
jgi:phage terminase small subunit